MHTLLKVCPWELLKEEEEVDLRSDERDATRRNPSRNKSKPSLEETNGFFENQSVGKIRIPANVGSIGDYDAQGDADQRQSLKLTLKFSGQSHMGK